MTTHQAIAVIIAFSVVVSDAYVIKKVVWPKSAVSNKAEITCWTCRNMTSNEACNDWAPNIHCPRDHTVCLTSHTVDRRTGNSIHVHKRCALPNECNSHVVGCRQGHISHVQTCTSCCTGSYCNERVPHDHQTALMYSTLETGGSSSISHVSVMTVVMLSLTGRLMSRP
ncbi:hypothetical protein LSAT2_022012 [Lamellibrachia satsuma]|nr:hypothetical protein LSAT2_022012 [Lamellibrachia satsuma]